MSLDAVETKPTEFGITGTSLTITKEGKGTTTPRRPVREEGPWSVNGQLN